jgi:hypothetical protein
MKFDLILSLLIMASTFIAWIVGVQNSWWISVPLACVVGAQGIRIYVLCRLVEAYEELRATYDRYIEVLKEKNQ